MDEESSQPFYAQPNKLDSTITPEIQYKIYVEPNLKLNGHSQEARDYVLKCMVGDRREQ